MYRSIVKRYLSLLTASEAPESRLKAFLILDGPTSESTQMPKLELYARVLLSTLETSRTNDFFDHFLTAARKYTQQQDYAVPNSHKP